MAYATDELKLALGRRQVLFAKAQTARGALAEPAATDTVLISSAEFSQQYEEHPDNQLRDSRDEGEPVKGILPHGEISLSAPLKVSGTAGTDPEIADVIKTVMGAKAADDADTVQASPTPTISGCTVSDGTHFVIGQMRYIQLAAGPYLRRITGVNVNAITWEPDLPSAPAAAANIYAAVRWNLATDLEDMTIFGKQDDRIYSFQDCGIGKLGVKVDGKSVLEGTFNGGFTRFFMAPTDELSVGCNDSITTITAKNGNKFIVGAGCIFKMQDEILKATARSGNDLTVVRGYMSSTPAAHSADCPITPWYPTITEGGSRIHCKFGTSKWKLGSTWEDLPLLEFSLDMDNNLRWLDEEKNEDEVTHQSFSAGFSTSGARKITATLKMLYRRKFSKLYTLSDADTIGRIIVPVGNAVGYTWVFVLHQMRFLRPAVTGADEQIIDLALRPYSTTAYNDAMSIHQL